MDTHGLILFGLARCILCTSVCANDTSRWMCPKKIPYIYHYRQFRMHDAHILYAKWTIYFIPMRIALTTIYDRNFINCAYITDHYFINILYTINLMHGLYCENSLRKSLCIQYFKPTTPLYAVSFSVSCTIQGHQS